MVKGVVPVTEINRRHGMWNGTYKKHRTYIRKVKIYKYIYRFKRLNNRRSLLFGRIWKQT